MDVVDWLWLVYGELPNLISPKPLLILLSTLSLRDIGSVSPFGPSVALFGAESSDCGRSNRRGSALDGDVGDTIDATLMLLVAGEESGCGSRLVEIGDGVMSAGEVGKAEPGGLRTLTPMHDAAEVSAGRNQQPGSGSRLGVQG
jgi:hypothetical protein